jgi:hypothetical protein
MDPEPKRRLKATYQQVLRPLVRILLRNGIEASEFVGIAHLAFVDVARTSILGEGREVKNSELARITGLTVDQVETVLKSKSNNNEQEGNLNRIMKVLSGWHTDNDFTGPYGLPLELTFEDIRSPNFCSLVGRYAPEAGARELLNELIRLGAVKETDDNWFKVLTRTYLPKFDNPDSLDHLGQSIENFANTIDYNRTEREPTKKLFERVVDADDGIRPEDLPRFRSFIRERAQLLLEEIDNWLSQLDPPTMNDESEPVRTGLGIYQYIERKDSDEKLD